MHKCAGDLVSAIVLLEAAVRRYEDALSPSHSSVKAASQRAEQLLAALSHDQRQQVSYVPGFARACVRACLCVHACASAYA